MGFFDRLKKSSPHASVPPANSSVPPATSSPAQPQPDPAPSATPNTPAGNLLPQLTAARAKLEARDLPAAVAIYEEVLATAGDRPDVLVTISGDLGSCGFVETISELIAPRYDAERHGPATGLNLLQAYIATRNPVPAQHLLDILFTLKQPELEERLWGFSNAIAELIEGQKRGTIGPPGAPDRDDAAAPKTIELVSISKPIWAYGVETIPGILPAKTDGLRRVAFAQLAILAQHQTNADPLPPDAPLSRFSRGLPLWLSETMYFSRQYAPIAAVGLHGRERFAHFHGEWTADNIRQLVDSTSGGLDYLVTGALQEHSGDFELLLRLWEIKKFRERKSFALRWTPATADAELARLHEQLRLFFEWSACPPGDGLAYSPPPKPMSWIDTLAASLSTFLADKDVLPVEQLTELPAPRTPAATSDAASLAHLTLRDRCRRLGIAMPADEPLTSNPPVTQATQLLG